MASVPFIATVFELVPLATAPLVFAEADMGGSCAAEAFDPPFARRESEEVATAGEAAGAAESAWAGNLRVRGRFSFRSGSWAGSAGDAVADGAFRLRAAEAGLSDSLARSNAPHARLSSKFSCTG